MVDQNLARVASSHPEAFGTGPGTPFSSLHLEGGQGGLTHLSTGISSLFQDHAGESQLASVVSAPELGWLVSTTRPERVAFVSLRKVRVRVLLMSIAAALLAGVVALFLARQISQPVARLIAIARRIAKEDFHIDRPIHAYGELGQLAHAFNLALEHLAHYRRELRQTTQMRLRLSRLMASASAQEALAIAEAFEDEPTDQLIVLYADIVIVRHVPDVKSEDLVALLGAFFSAAQATVERHGGWLDRYSGDAVIGIFVETPEPALAAAQDLIQDAKAVAERWRESTPVDLNTAVAIATGPGTLRKNIDGDALSVAGPVVERAAIAQADATPGTILIDDQTRSNLKSPPALHPQATGENREDWFALLP